MGSSDSETTMDPDGDPFLEEILFKILTRLPVKSLCRFRSVSKQWFSIISDPYFVDAHLACSKSVSPKLLISVIEDVLNPDKICFYSVDYPEHEQGQPLHATSHGSIDFDPNATISSSPSGLICFTRSDGIRVGNPITGEFDLIQTGVSHIYSQLSIFGYDPIDKNHIILRLENCYYAPGLCGKSRVFSFTDNQFHDTPPHPRISAAKSAVCINIIIYFIAWGDLDAGIRRPCLFAFDIRSEKFQIIYRPQDSFFSETFIVELVIEYKGRLALVCYRKINDDKVWMWILEDTEKPKWSFKSFVVPWREKLMRDGISIDVELPYAWDREINLSGATDRGELVLFTPLHLTRGSLYLFLYEIDTNTLRRFEVDGFFGGLYGGVRLNFVVESLGSVNGLSKKKKGRELPRETIPS